jgi:hypothetical protein
MKQPPNNNPFLYPREMVVRIAGRHDLHIFGFGDLDVFDAVHKRIIKYIEDLMPLWAEICFY